MQDGYIVKVYDTKFFYSLLGKIFIKISFDVFHFVSSNLKYFSLFKFFNATNVATVRCRMIFKTIIL